MAKKKNDDRFEKVEVQEGFVNDLSIWVDKETGVQYLVFTRGNGTGITPLLNADGSLRLYEPEVTETRDED